MQIQTAPGYRPRSTTALSSGAASARISLAAHSTDTVTFGSLSQSMRTAVNNKVDQNAARTVADNMKLSWNLAVDNCEGQLQPDVLVEASVVYRMLKRLKFCQSQQQALPAVLNYLVESAFGQTLGDTELGKAVREIRAEILQHNNVNGIDEDQAQRLSEILGPSGVALLGVEGLAHKAACDQHCDRILHAIDKVPETLANTYLQALIQTPFIVADEIIQPIVDKIPPEK